MKKHWMKILGLVLCLTMVLSLFAGCGQSEEAAQPEAEAAQNEAPEKPEEIEVPEVPEEKPQVAVLESVTIYWLGDAETHTVGDDLTLDESGRISGLAKLYDTVAFQYDENGALVRVEVTDDEGSVGFESWTYTDGLLTASEYDPNDGFHSLQDVTVETVCDDAGRVTMITEYTTYTDAEDGSVSQETNVYELTYDEAGRVSEVACTLDGEADHVTQVTYDENGNMLSYVNVGADSGSEYLRVEFAYTMVDEDSVSAPETDPGTAFLNWEYMLNHIL